MSVYEICQVYSHKLVKKLLNIKLLLFVMPLIEFTPQGMYVPQADVYIDPWRGVEKAIITHGHSDHARWGCNHYLTHHQNIPIIQRRLGNINTQGVAYNESIYINGVEFSFHPAGHVLGSSQIRVAYNGEVWVASGDYKLQADGVATPFEPVVCHTFITESTFGLPIYSWKPQDQVMQEINDWWLQNKDLGLCSVIFAYSLGKAQRILCNLDHSIGEVFVHGAVASMNEAHTDAGVQLPKYTVVSPTTDKLKYKGALIIAPSSADNTPWMKKFEPYVTASASGWMALRGARRRMSVDKGFVLSDHADWYGLNEAVVATNAQHVIATHGYTRTFAQWLATKGIESSIAETRFVGESIDKQNNDTVDPSSPEVE
jgi:putative mRNA 3-end processing factor